MATRMQQRRGTAAQWLSTNSGNGPILNAGEIGFESDTGKFKVGDGVNHWIDLEYFLNEAQIATDIEGAISDTEKGAANGVASLDSNAKLTASQIPTTLAPLASPTFTGTVNAAAVSTSGNVTVGGNLTVNGTTTTVNSTEVNVTNAFVFEGTTADAYETTLTVIDPTADRTLSLPDSSGTLATTSYVDGAFNAVGADISTINTTLTTKQDVVTGVSDTEIGYLNGVTSSIQTQIDSKQAAVANVSETEIGYLDGVTSSIQTQLDAKRNNADDLILPATKLIVFEGATDDAYETTVTVSDPTADRIITLPNATGTVTLNDATQTLTNKTISGADNTISITSASVTDFTEAAQDAVGNVVGTGLSYNDSTGAISVDTTAIQAVVSGVSNTEIGYLAGVTSAIQTQLDGKSATGHTHTASNVTDFTEAAQDAVGNALGSGLSYNDSTGAISVDTTAIQAVVSGVSNTEIGYLDGVTSAIQTQLDNKLALAGGTLTGALTLNADPTSDLHAATKQYVDAATAGLNVHASVKVATTGSKVLANDFENGDIIDGVTLATGNRILIKDQSTKSENGVYIVNASGAPTRAADYNTTPEVDAGDFIFVEGGTVNGKTGWIQTNTVATIGTDDIEFTQFSGAGTYSAGTGLTLTGTIFSINTGTTADLSTAQTLTNKTIALGSNTISGTTAQFNSALTDGDFATLAGSQTLTNKTLTSPIMTTPTLGAATATSIAFPDGLTQSGAGVPSKTTIVNKTAAFNTSDADYRDNMLELGNTSTPADFTVTVTADGTNGITYPTGTSIDLVAIVNQTFTITNGAGVTLNYTPGNKLRAQWSSATLFKRAANTWVLLGDLKA